MPPNNQNEVQVGFSVDVTELQQGLSQAELLAQQALQRFNAASEQEQPSVSSTVPGAPPPIAPPVPIPQTPAPVPTSQPAGETPAPIAAAWEEFRKLQSFAQTAPDIAIAGLSGRGGLMGRITKGAIADPENAEQYQQLVVAMKDLTQSIKDGSKEGGGAEGGQVLGFLRRNAMLQAGGTIAQNVMSGNALAGAGSAIGGLIGLIGGPGGAMLGASVGGAIGGGIGSFLGGADEARQYSMMTADIAARLGNFDNDEALSIDNINNMNTRGYSPQETAQLFDLLRQGRVIDTVDESSKELVESIQALTRATGMNTDALAANYSSYVQLGGDRSANDYMAQVIAGAVASGMRSNLGEYSELLGSARMQLVYGSGMADEDGKAMRSIQGVLAEFMGGNSKTAELLRDNPMMAQQILSSFLATGGAQQYSFDSVAMQMAGIERGRTDEAFATPDQKVTNALSRQQFVIQSFLQGGAAGMMGMTDEQLAQAVQADPNFLQSKITSQNPNAAQAAALQDLLNTSYQAQFGKNPTAQDVQLFAQLGTSYLKEGSLSPQSIAPDGKTLADLITRSQQTEGDKARESAAERHQEMMRFMNRFASFLTSIDKMVTDILKTANQIADDIKPIADFLGNLIGQQAGSQIQAFAANPAGEVSKAGSKIIAQIPNPTGVAQSAGASLGLGTAWAIGEYTGFNQQLEGFSEATGLPNPANLMPGIANFLLDPGGTIGGALVDRVHDFFNDTPDEGVLASASYNTFQFAPGDRIKAVRDGATNISDSASVNLTVNVTVHGGGDENRIREASKSGVRSGTDEFLERWERGRLDPRNKPRINNTLY